MSWSFGVQGKLVSDRDLGDDAQAGYEQSKSAMMLSRSITWLLFLSLPLMALARRFPNGGAIDKVASREVLLKISVQVFVREDSLSKDVNIYPISDSNANRAVSTSMVNVGFDARRELEGMPRFMGPGFGSRPPKCIGSCGTCSPCEPVNVPIGGVKTDDEYYPEVWRCQCNEQMYIP